MALSGPIDTIILPEMETNWRENIRSKWFVEDSSDVNQAREPGVRLKCN